MAWAMRVFTASSWTEKQCVFAAADPGRQWPDRRPDCGSSFGLNWKSRINVKALVSVTELRLFVASVQQTLTAAGKFVGDQDGDQVDGSHGLRLSL